MPYLVGLTGNIGTGKSTVAALLRDLGAAVIDADRVAHEAMLPGTPGYARIVERFGREVLAPDATVDRRKLGAIVFNDPAALRDLEAILHPEVRVRIRQRIAAAERPVVVVEAIKLLESGLYLEMDAVWAVVAPRDEQVRRLVASRGLPLADAELRVDAQAPQADKARRADVVIENDGDLETTRARVAAAWDAIAAGRAPRRRGEPR